MSFKTLGLSEPLLKAIQEQAYTTPTPIQLQTIPAVLKGLDMMASAQTGTGKTAGFTLPLLQLLSYKTKASGNRAKALILAPTRELAAQIQESVMAYGKHLPMRSAVVFGGVKVNPQMMRLRSGVEILVATPGRLLDLYNQNAIKFDEIEFLILDEADRMLDMGFIHDIRKIVSLLPPKKQCLLFSATFSPEIRELAKKFLKNPVEINVSPRNTIADTVKHKMHPVDKARKASLLIHLIKTNNWYQALVFCRTKHGSNRLVQQLNQEGIDALAIHGNKSQSARTKALDSFKNGKVQILVATDIAARGIDVENLEQVVNFDLPNIPEDYVHRIGRSGRAGAAGFAISLVCADEVAYLHDIEKLIKFKLDRELIDGFEPNHQLPTTSVAARAAQKQGQPNGGGARSGRNTSQARTAPKKKQGGSYSSGASGAGGRRAPASRRGEART